MLGEGISGVTLIHPLGLTAVVVLGFALVLLPRRYAVLPIIIMACMIPTAQRLVIMGNDFTLLRILVLFAWVRLFVRGEFQGFHWNRLDSTVILWKMSGTVVYVIAYGSVSALINRCGWVFDGLGMYFFFRCVIRSFGDLYFLVRAFIFVSIPVAFAFCVERATGRNIFSLLGGVPEITVVREGKLRCQGAYSHAILAGCFWAAVMPWMLAEFVRGRKLLSVAGIASSLIVIVNCASSTPILALCFMIVGMLLYFLRAHVRALRWGLFLLLTLLHLVMNNPVWHLIARINVVGGSTGYHRYKIMDATIHNFSKWWMLGEKDPLSWGVDNMIDITNQYILEALRGGLLSLVCFVVMIGVAFGLVGKSLHECGDKTADRVFVWSLGAALFVHVCIFFSVSYFGQIVMLWYLTLAVIGSLPDITSRAGQGPLDNQPTQRYSALAKWAGPH